jgi:hypothetical protein
MEIFFLFPLMEKEKKRSSSADGFPADGGTVFSFDFPKELISLYLTRIRRW